MTTNLLLLGGAIVIHRKTFSLYVVLTTAKVEATGEEVVVYEAYRQRGNVDANTWRDPERWTRPVAEFLDGRFALLCEEGNKLNLAAVSEPCPAL